MIIQIRGTSGSGKSYIVRQVMALYPQPWHKVYRQGRKQPLAYRLKQPGQPELAIIGHYETKCGGCDTISIPGQSYQIIFDLIRRNAQEGRNVLFEGLLISGDLNWTAKLKELGIPLLVIELTVPLEECLESINNRRRERLGTEFTPVKPENTIAKHKLCTKVCARLSTEHGIPVEQHTRESALARIREILNV